MSQVLIAMKDPAMLRKTADVLLTDRQTVEGVSTLTAARKSLHRNPLVDVLLLDIDWAADSAFDLIGELREHPLFSRLPLIVYTRISQKNIVLQALDSGIRNYLIYPCEPHQLTTEIRKAAATNWRSKLFEDTTNFCRLHRLSLSEYREELLETGRVLKACQDALLGQRSFGVYVSCAPQVSKLKASATRSGFTALEGIAAQLGTVILGQNDEAVDRYSEHLESLQTVLNEKSNQLRATIELEERKHRPSPHKVVPPPTYERILEQLETIDNLPVFGTLADAFKTAAAQVDMDVQEVVSLIEKDPALTAKVLSFANSASVGSQLQVEEIEVAIQLLGFRRVQFLAFSLNTALEINQLFTAYDWKAFWINQVGCAMICEELLELMNAPALPQAYVAGLLRDIGKIILSNFYPDIFKQAIAKARAEKRPLTQVEQELFGTNHEAIGAKYAAMQRFPEVYQTVIQFQSHPHKAPIFPHLAGLVNIANYFCDRYGIGISGNPPLNTLISLNDMPGWKIVKAWAHPSLPVESLEAKMAKKLRRIRHQLDDLSIQLEI